MRESYDGRQVVGMDLHRHRSVLVRTTEDGRKLETARIDNSPAALRTVLARAGSSPRVVVEATYEWYWATATPVPQRRQPSRAVMTAAQARPGMISSVVGYWL